MAGIGFRLIRMASQDGAGGIIAAAVHGAAISAGPWLCMSAAILGLQLALVDRIAEAEMQAVQAVLAHAFSLSALVAAPVMGVATRMVADALFANRPARIPAILLAALATGIGAAAIVAVPLFAVAADLSPTATLLAMACLCLLTLIWIATLFLTAVRDHRRVLRGYAAGVLAAAPIVWATPAGASATLPLLAVTVGAIVVASSLLFAIRASFPEPAAWPEDWWPGFLRHRQVALAGLCATAAIWVDKWIIWHGPGSIAATGLLRSNPLFDGASFLGLLSLVAGLTLLLVVVETRFDRSFGRLMAACTGHAVLGRLDTLRADVATVLVEGGRVLVAGQGALALLLWLTAPFLLAAVGLDPRGIIGFRFVVVGALFHLLLLYATIILSYYDLNGRALAASAAFLVVSASASWLSLDDGYARFGWGYLAGALFGAVVALAAAGLATRDLLYLLFVRNNPAIRGEDRAWA